MYIDLKFNPHVVQEFYDKLLIRKYFLSFRSDPAKSSRDLAEETLPTYSVLPPEVDKKKLQVPSILVLSVIATTRIPPKSRAKPIPSVSFSGIGIV
jgi:hypothetical protein